MDLRSIQYFVRVAEIGSLSRSAEHLHIAQPALSRHIQRLEDDLGVEVFRRSSRGVRLTAAGTELYEKAVRILHDFNRTREEIRALAGMAPSGKVTLGVSPGSCRILAPPIIARMKTELPEVELKIVTAVNQQLHDWIIEGSIDCAVLYEPRSSRVIHCTHLVKEDIVIVGPPAMADRGPISGEQLSAIELTMTDASTQLFAPMLERQGISLRIVRSINSIETLRVLAAQGLAVTLMPYSMVREERAAGTVAVLPVVKPSLRRDLAFSTPPRGSANVAIRGVEALVSSIVRDLDSQNAFRVTERGDGGASDAAVAGSMSAGSRDREPCAMKPVGGSQYQAKQPSRAIVERTVGVR